MVSATLSPFLTFLSSSFPFARIVLTCLTRYHFRCIQLSEDDASEICESYFIFTWINCTRLMYPISVVYVCPSCQEKTGRRTVSKYQKTTCELQLPLPPLCFRIVVLFHLVTPHLRLLVPVFVPIRLGTGTLPLRQPELHVPHARQC